MPILGGNHFSLIFIDRETKTWTFYDPTACIHLRTNAMLINILKHQLTKSLNLEDFFFVDYSPYYGTQHRIFAKSWKPDCGPLIIKAIDQFLLKMKQITSIDIPLVSKIFGHTPTSWAIKSHYDDQSLRSEATINKIREELSLRISQPN